MQLGIFAKTFPGATPAEVMRAARAAGYRSVHYNLACSGLPSMPDAIAPAACAEIVAAAASSGVRIVGLSGTYNMAHPDPEARAEGARRLRVVIATARAIGAPLVTLCTGSRDAQDQWRAHPNNASPAAWADMLASMGDALEAATLHGIDLGIEPELANVVGDAGAAARLLEDLPDPRLKIVLDPANLFEQADDATRTRVIDDAIERLGPRITMAHAKDRSPSGAFVAAGTGVVDFGRFVARLRAAGFDGPLVTHGCLPDEAPAVAERLRGIAGVE